MIQPNAFLFGDNLILLKQIADENIDLIYIDSPFATGNDFYTLDGKYLAYSDKYTVDELIQMLKPRLIECHRILRRTGSMYVHGDYRFIPYLRVFLDSLFGQKNFRNEIIAETNPISNSGTANDWGSITTSILFYTKSDTYTFHKIKKKLTENELKAKYPHREEVTSRYFGTTPLIKKGNKPNILHFIDRGEMVLPIGKRFVWSQITYNEMVAKNPNIIYWTKNGVPRVKNYLDEHTHEYFSNLWTKMYIPSTSNELTGFPTQKSEKLMKRIILASSNEDDIVLDCFSGSGSTLAVAKKLGRKYIGFENSKVAYEIAKARLQSVRTNKKLF